MGYISDISDLRESQIHLYLILYLYSIWLVIKKTHQQQQQQQHNMCEPKIDIYILKKHLKETQLIRKLT